MTTKKKAAIPATEQKIEVRKSPDFKSIYVNWIQAASSPYDVFMNLGETSPLENGDIEVEHKVRVVFSPLEAKLVTAIMAKTILAYEKQFGTIVIPESLRLLMRGLNETPSGEGEKQTEGD